MQRWLVLLLLITGCGFGIAGPDPDRPRSQAPECDTGKGAVILDGAMASVSGIIALSLAGDSEPAVALLPAAIGALYLAGALRGNSNANRCIEAKGQYESYMAARETMPSEPPRHVPSLRQREPEEPAEYGPPVTASTTRAPAPRLAPSPPVAAPPVAAPPVAAPPAPAPAPATGPAKPLPAKAPPVAQPEPEDDWSAFWREVD